MLVYSRHFCLNMKFLSLWQHSTPEKKVIILHFHPKSVIFLHFLPKKCHFPFTFMEFYFLLFQFARIFKAYGPRFSFKGFPPLFFFSLRNKTFFRFLFLISNTFLMAMVWMGKLCSNVCTQDFQLDSLGICGYTFDFG